MNRVLVQRLKMRRQVSYQIRSTFLEIGLFDVGVNE